MFTFLRVSDCPLWESPISESVCEFRQCNAGQPGRCDSPGKEESSNAFQLPTLLDPQPTQSLTHSTLLRLLPSWRFHIISEPLPPLSASPLSLSPLGALPSLAPGQQDNTPAAAAAPTMAATESFHTFNLSFKISPWVHISKVFLPTWSSWLRASLLQKFFGRLTRPVCISMSWHSEYKYKSQRLHMQWLQLWKNVMKPQSGRMWASNKLALNIESSTLSKHFFGQIGVKADGLKVTLNKKPQWKNNFDL